MPRSSGPTPFVLAPAALVVSSIVFFFSYPWVDNDLWGHLLFGRESLLNGWPLPQNFYSFTAAEHEWINHEWLAEVVMYLAYRLAGSPGLILLKVAMAAGVVWILNLNSARSGASTLVRALALIWAITILWPGFNVRPQIFSFLFFALLLHLQYRHEDGESYRLYWVPPLVALWINFHGGVLAGCGALGLYALWATIRELRLRSVRSALLRVVLPCAIAVPALLLNPYGGRLVEFLLLDVQLVRPITEWDPIPLLGFGFLEFKLAVVAVVVVAIRTDLWRRWDFALALLTAFLAFRHMRHTPLFAIAAAPFLSAALGGVARWSGGGAVAPVSPAIRRMLSGGVAVVVALQLMWVGGMHRPHGFRLVVPGDRYPTRAADFLIRNEVRGNLVAPFDWGEYLIWKLYPQMRVSIDGRYTTCYPMDVIDQNLTWMQGGPGWDVLLERFPAGVALSGVQLPVTARLRRHRDWVEIYSDATAAVFVRAVPEHSALIERFRAGSLEPPGPVVVRFPG